MQLLLGRTRVGPQLVDEAHVAAGGTRAVEDDVARARHRHQVPQPRHHDRAIGPPRKRIAHRRIGPAVQRNAVAAVPAEGPAGSTREHEADARVAREAGEHTRMA